MGEEIKEKLQEVVLNIETINAELKKLRAALADAYKAAKEEGFNVKAIRETVKAREKSPKERQEWRDLCDSYLAAAGEKQAEFNFDAAF